MKCQVAVDAHMSLALVSTSVLLKLLLYGQQTTVYKGQYVNVSFESKFVHVHVLRIYFTVAQLSCGVCVHFFPFHFFMQSLETLCFSNFPWMRLFCGGISLDFPFEYHALGRNWPTCLPFYSRHRRLFFYFSIYFFVSIDCFCNSNNSTDLLSTTTRHL